jgi:hypothetical protein
MVISNKKLQKTKYLITFSAEVAFNGNKAEIIYFETDIKNQSIISADYSPFLAAVLLPCMKTGEDIVIEGPVSKQLLHNTEKIMKLVEGWNVGLKKVNIISHPGFVSGSNATTKKMLKQVQHDKKRVGVFFSAGVDSFYSYLKNKRKITDLILVHGFDVPLQNILLFGTVEENVKSVAKEESKNLIIVKTNIAEIVEKYLVWDFAHGGALAAVGLFLSKELGEIYISGAVRRDKLFPYGTHPDLDKLWSTENQTLIHEGSEYCRLEKVMNKVGKSPLALRHLHVCTQNIKGKYNCSKCFKCMTTMIELVCADVLDKSSTFDRKIDLNSVRKMHYDYSLLYNILGEASFEELKKQNREPELQIAIAESLAKSKRMKLSKKIANAVGVWDQKYNKRRLYRWLFRTSKNQDRNLIFKFLLRIGVFK